MFSNDDMFVVATIVSLSILWGTVEIVIKRRNNKKIDELAAKDREKLKETEGRKIKP
jgi:hypothetical protein